MKTMSFTDSAAADIFEATRQLRWVEADDSPINGIHYKLQQLWFNRRTGYGEWRDVPYVGHEDAP